jgi:hypothetical protein
MSQGRGAREQADLLRARDRRFDRQSALGGPVAEERDLLDALHELVRACVDIGGAAAAGIVVRNTDGIPELLAASDGRLFELFRLQQGDGPCTAAMESGERVTVLDRATASSTSAPFAAAAALLGFSAVHAFPMRLREERLGALSLCCGPSTMLSEADARSAQALADIATVSILHLRALRSSRRLADQLQAALDSRVVIEQAKGVLSEAGQVDMERAFCHLRQYARNRNLRLAAVAAAVATRGLSPDEILAWLPSSVGRASLARAREV